MARSFRSFVIAVGMLSIAAGSVFAQQIPRTSATGSQGVSSARNSSTSSFLGTPSSAGAPTGNGMAGASSGTSMGGSLSAGQGIDRGSGFVGNSSQNIGQVGNIGPGGGSGMGGLGGMGMGMSGMGMGGMGMGGMGMGMGGMNGMNGMNNRFSQSQNTNDPRKKIRSAVRLGFQVARPSGFVRSTTIRETISRLPVSKRWNNLDVTIDERVATLRGIVKSEEEKRLAQRLMMLEPGVSQVNNQLTVSESGE